MIPAEKPTSAMAAVIGGGIVGLACAIGLQRRGYQTLLFDPAMLPRPASWGNAGHLATEQVEPLASRASLAGLPARLFCRGGAASFPVRDIAAWLPFGLRLLRASSPARFNGGTQALKSVLAPALAAWHRLAESIGHASLLADDGHYLVWETENAARLGRARWDSTDIGAATLEYLPQEELTRLGALCSASLAGGLRFHGTGRVRDPGALLLALEQAFLAEGGQWHRECVQRLEVVRSRAALRLVTGETMSPDLLVVSAGLGSADLLEPLGCRVPMIAERGYHLQTQDCDWPDMPPVVFEERSLIVSRFVSGLRAASFVEFAHESSPPDASKWQRLREHIAALGLPMRGELTEWMGARPTLPDYLPALGRFPGASNLLYAFGHQHLGLTLAAITGELIAALSRGDEPSVDLRPFSLARFRGN